MMAVRRRLSVALVTETYLPEVNGVAMTLGRLVEGLQARNHRIELIRPRQQHETIGLQTDGSLLLPGLPIPRYPELRFGLPATRRLLAHWRKSPPDIVHIATEGPLGLSALFAARRLGLPVVSTFHTNFHRYSAHYGIGWMRRGIERYLRWFHNHTAATLVPTPALAEELTQQGYRDVSVLSRGVDTELFNPARRSMALREAWGAGPDDLVCLVVGRLAPEKNLKLALAAFGAIRAKYPKARLVCVGDGPLRAQLERRHPECLCVGARFGKDLAAHYASADLFLFPSLTETFGNVVVEALASGLPVVAFDLAAASELIHDGENGRLVPPGDEAAFIAAAQSLATALSERPELRLTAAMSVCHLDWERIYDGYIALLSGIIDRHAATAFASENVFLAPD
ncbi:MAG: glycosyltransferase family 1 protein [Rhodocyclaceae bacterium]|nr:glycosyltransferase family 1 protein [Rhodocyclaceae bacterium]